MLSSGVQTCARSEEHTSELQSLTNLVCRLLLEKNQKMFKLKFSSFSMFKILYGKFLYFKHIIWELGKSRFSRISKAVWFMVRERPFSRFRHVSMDVSQRKIVIRYLGKIFSNSSETILIWFVPSSIITSFSLYVLFKSSNSVV